MVTQEEKAIMRIKLVHKYIKECEEIGVQNIFDWTYLNLGITEKTCAGYLRALKGMGMIKIEGQIVKDIKKPGV